MTKIAAHQPGNARKLSQILSVAGKSGVDGGKRAMEVVMSHGQNGMDALYAAIRKGPAGLKFVADHPALVARGLKNIRKGSVWGTHEWSDFSRRFGWLAAPIKASLLGLLTMGLFHLLVPKWMLQRLVCKPTTATGSTAPASPTQRILSSKLGITCSLGLLTTLVVLAYTGLTPRATSTDDFLETHFSTTGTTQAVSGVSSPALSATMVLLTLGIQIGIWVFVRNKLADVERPDDSPQLQAKRLENLDIFFDLPLYAGLALTIFSFILITYDAGVSRLLAYTSTIIGILIAVSVRIHLVHPMKERLLKKMDTRAS